MWRVFLIVSGLLLAANPARASAVCQDDAILRPLPAGLVPAVEKAFGLQNANPAWVQKTTVIRCMDGRLWACNVGANLPCGRANTATTLPAGDDWCKENPNSDFIPAYITGHDSSQQWRCTDGAPAINGPPEPVDHQGYLTHYWKILGISRLTAGNAAMSAFAGQCP